MRRRTPTSWVTLNSLRKLEAMEKALRDNAKIVIPTGSELINVIGDLAGAMPVPVMRQTAQGK